jgi:hypothetical protein
MAQTRTISIELAHDSPNEQRAKDQLDEEIHWFLTGKNRDASKAIADVRKLYSDAPEAPADGGAGSRQSTTLHLIVCQLEFESIRARLGAEQAVAVLKESRIRIACPA